MTHGEGSIGVRWSFPWRAGMTRWAPCLLALRAWTGPLFGFRIRGDILGDGLERERDDHPSRGVAICASGLILRG